MRWVTTAALAGALAAIGAVGAQAQGYGYNQGYYPDPRYEQDQQQYEQNSRDYEAQQNAWQARRDSYDADREAYRHRLHAYERARAAYDAEYGPGAYERIYPVPREEYYAPAPRVYYDPD